MDATANLPRVPTTPAPAARAPRNWSAIVRIGVVAALILGLVGYALKVTYESVIRGGVVQVGDVYKVELRQMSSFEMDPERGTLADVPERFRHLDGKRVVLEGEVAPTGSGSEAVRRFDLCYSVQQCCFSGPPKAQHFVNCFAPKGKAVQNYEGRGAVRVTGTLHVKIIRDAGRIQSVFQMDLERVEPIS